MYMAGRYAIIAAGRSLYYVCTLCLYLEITRSGSKSRFVSRHDARTNGQQQTKEEGAQEEEPGEDRIEGNDNSDALLSIGVMYRLKPRGPGTSLPVAGKQLASQAQQMYLAHIPACLTFLRMRTPMAHPAKVSATLRLSH